MDIASTNDYKLKKINVSEFYSPCLNSITPIPSQGIRVQYADSEFLVYLDSGATVSFITRQLAKSLSMKIRPNGQLALLADEKTRMQSLGEIDILVITKAKVVLRLRALIVEAT